MRIDPRKSLGWRIGALAAVNLVLLALIVVIAAGVRVPHSTRDLVLQIAGDRLLDLSRQVALGLNQTPASEADRVLAGFQASYGSGTRLLVVTNSSRLIAGPRLPIPPEVGAMLRGEGPPPGGVGPGPRRGRPLGRPDGAPPVRRPDGAGPIRMPNVAPFLVSVRDTPRHWFGVRIPIRLAGDTGPVPGTLLVALDSLSSPLLVPTRLLTWGLVALGVTALCWWPFLHGVTTSVGRLEQATARIAEGQFATTVGITRDDELGRLAESVEQMAGRLDQLVVGQKRFLSDTAHELRSPLGHMRVALELLKRQFDGAEQRHLADLEEDVAAMSQLTDDLLTLAKADLGTRALDLAPVSVADGVARAVERENRPDVTINVDVPPDARVRADRDLFIRAIANLLRNAVRYAGEFGPVSVGAEVTADTVDVVVADQGPGVPADALERLLTPFYRHDQSRDRRSGGVGLGLSIVQKAVERCGGTVQCKNLVPNGLEVRLTWQRAV